MLGVLLCTPLKFDFNGTSKRPSEMQRSLPGVIGCNSLDREAKISKRLEALVCLGAFLGLCDRDLRQPLIAARFLEANFMSKAQQRVPLGLHGVSGELSGQNSCVGQIWRDIRRKPQKRTARGRGWLTLGDPADLLFQGVEGALNYGGGGVDERTCILLKSGKRAVRDINPSLHSPVHEGNSYFKIRYGISG